MEEFLRLTKPKIPDLVATSKFFSKSENARWYTNFGPCYEDFRAQLMNLTGADDVLVVNNATVALEILLKGTRKNLIGESKRRYVITPSYTFAATTTSILAAGLLPIYVDVDLDDWHASTEHVELLATKYSDSLACFLLCHTFGTTPARSKIEEWKKSADKIGVPLFIDSAAGFGSSFNLEQNEIQVADATVYSMHATKPFAVGEGGIIAGSARIVGTSKQISNFDFDSEKSFTEFGTNGKISEIMCAIALAALENFTESLTKRRNVATKLKESFYDLEYINFQKGSENSTWQSLYLQVKDSENLKKITENLTNQNIEFRRDWGKPTHHYIQSDFETNLDNTEILSKSCLTLPLWEEMEDEQIFRIARAVKLG
jgi:dTDP-4-amino-4,6-dideoxygalactose transaminase